MKISKILAKTVGVAARRKCRKRNKMLQKESCGAQIEDLTFSDSLDKSIVMRKERFCMKSNLFAILILGCSEKPFHISEMTSFSLGPNPKTI